MTLHQNLILDIINLYSKRVKDLTGIILGLNGIVLCYIGKDISDSSLRKIR